MFGRPTTNEIYIFGLFIEGFFYGLYSGIFAIYLQYQASKKDRKKTQNVIFYSICVLYVLSAALFMAETASVILTFLGEPIASILHILLFKTILFGCCNFIAQCILIYRCWIVWGHNIRVVITPSILAVASLLICIAVTNSSTYIFSDQVYMRDWAVPVTYLYFALPLAVDPLVTGLIVFRIFKVFREVKATSDDKILGATGGHKLRRIIFIIIESGMVWFSVQLVWVVTSIVWTDAAFNAFSIIVGIHQMFTGITPTIILVRTSMRLSFDDKKSIEEVAIESLRFASNHPHSAPETGSIVIVIGQDSRDDGDIDVRRSHDIEVVEG